MCITFKVQFDTHAPNYTALYPMIPQSRYFYNNFTLNFNDKTYIHTYIHTYTHTHTHTHQWLTPWCWSLHPLQMKLTCKLQHVVLILSNGACLKKYIHTYRPIFCTLFSLSPSLPDSNTTSAVLFGYLRFCPLN
jgi:hypothetical protein